MVAMSQPPEWSGQDPQFSPYGQPPHGQPYGEPYGQPQLPAAGPPREAFAGFWIRFLGALIDGVILSVVGAVLGAVLPDTQLLGPTTVVGLAIGAAYFGYLHSSKAGQTIGQLAVGIRLVNAADGGQVAPGAAILRWAMSYVSGIPLLLGYLWMLWDPQRQTWHDKVASTYVVKASHYPAPASFGQR